MTIRLRLSQVIGTPFVVSHLAVVRFLSGQRGQSPGPPEFGSHTYNQTSSTALSVRKQWILVIA
jgi:hypothetical protein